MIERDLRSVAAEAGRMPSANELRERGANPLAVAVSRRGGFYAWADRLGLNVKDSETLRGIDAEHKTAEHLESLGFAVDLTTVKAPYDLLVNARVRIDVKSAKYGDYVNSKTGGHVRGFVFRPKPEPTCDLYILCGVGEDSEILWRYYVPAEEARIQTLTITPTGKKYAKYLENIDALKAMVNSRP